MIVGSKFEILMGDNVLAVLPISVWGDTGSVLLAVNTPMFVLSRNRPVTVRGS